MTGHGDPLPRCTCAWRRLPNGDVHPHRWVRHVAWNCPTHGRGLPERPDNEKGK